MGEKHIMYLMKDIILSFKLLILCCMKLLIYSVYFPGYVKSCILRNKTEFIAYNFFN